MPEPAIALGSGQAEDLRELLEHAETIGQWLLHAEGKILDDLAQAAYPAHFQPRSAVFRLTENLVHIPYRLHKTLNPGGLDTSVPIGNQIRSGYSRSSGSRA